MIQVVCEHCGKQFESQRSTKKFCTECSAEIHRQKMREAREKSAEIRRIRIHGQTDRLSRDVHEAIEQGISYGEYKRRHIPFNDYETQHKRVKDKIATIRSREALKSVGANKI